jgi:hypothetical protein
MATKLDKTIKRELDINGQPYMLSISPSGLKIVEKGKRKGVELSWEQVLRGDVAVSGDLADSLDLTME